MNIAGINMNNINPEIILKLLIYGYEAPCARLNIPLFTVVHEFITSTTRFSNRPHTKQENQFHTTTFYYLACTFCTIYIIYIVICYSYHL
jgi:hypothetical protein